MYVVEPKSFRPDTQKPRQTEREPEYFLKGIELLVHKCEKCVEIKGDYIEKQQSCFISVTLKSWSGRKLLDPTTYMYISQMTAVYFCVITQRVVVIPYRRCGTTYGSDS
jgi:hypothetical protein